jgi:hypothetical protein
MAVYYLETSALVKRYKTEKGSDVIEELFNGTKGNEGFATSLFTVLEVTATITRLFRGGVLDESPYITIMSRFLRDIRDLVVLPVENELILESIEVARGHYLKAGDAVQIASALQVSGLLGEGDEVVMIASDRDVCAAWLALGLKLINPESDDAMLNLLELRDEPR